MPYFESTEASIFYTDQGAGPALVMLHGWACDGADWSWLAADLVDDYRIVIPDHRGHGRSSVTGGRITPEILAQDVAELMDHLDLDDAVVIGHSLGAVVASVLASRRPEKIRGVALFDPVHGRDFVRISALVGDVAADPLGATERRFASFYGATTPPWLPQWHRRRLEGTPSEVITGVISGLFGEESSAGCRASSEQTLAAITVPLLAIYASSGEVRANWHRSLPAGRNHQVEVWEGARHFFFQEMPERTTDRVKQWLRTLD